MFLSQKAHHSQWQPAPALLVELLQGEQWIIFDSCSVRSGPVLSGLSERPKIKDSLVANGTLWLAHCGTLWNIEHAAAHYGI